MSGGEAVSRPHVLNPAEVEQTIWGATNDIAQGVRVVSSAEQSARRARRECDLAFARAYMAAAGPAHEKKYLAEIETAQQRSDAEVAEVAFEHAKRQMRALEGKLSAFQTISKSIQQMYGAASVQGRGH